MCYFTLLTGKSWKGPLLLSLITSDASKGEGREYFMSQTPKRLYGTLQQEHSNFKAFPPHTLKCEIKDFFPPVMLLAHFLPEFILLQQ